MLKLITGTIMLLIPATFLIVAVLKVCDIKDVCIIIGISIFSTIYFASMMYLIYGGLDWLKGR